MNIRSFIFISALFVSSSAYCLDKYPYTGICKELGFNQSIAQSQDAAEGIGKRQEYEKIGLALHKEGSWAKSNCYLIQALNISADHALELINTIGYNFAALENHTKALEYFEMGTGYDFDLDGWVQKKKTKPFNEILNNPIYKSHENVLRKYYEAMGLDVPK